MSRVIADLIRDLSPDPFRVKTPFEKSIAEATSALVASSEDPGASQVLSNWLGKHQPCLFGRITARIGGLCYCLLSAADLDESDEYIHEKIQRARRHWRRQAFAGDASGFVILAISDQIATALPNDVVKAVAKRLCFLYLGEDKEDEILLEDIFLRVPGKHDAEIHWKAGVNYFCAQGDQRWWQDHRIPAGMAFSVNSVGHLVRSFEVGRSFEETWKKLHLDGEEWSNFKIASLGDALVAAMQTINGAAITPSGKATMLLPADPTGVQPHRCPVVLPKNLQGKDFCEYLGYYHTDITIPSVYFRPNVERPAESLGERLDFTYLFDERVDNPAFGQMGRGIRVRTKPPSTTDTRPGAKSSKRKARVRTMKRRRVVGKQGRIADHPELQIALNDTSAPTSTKSSTTRDRD